MMKYHLMSKIPGDHVNSNSHFRPTKINSTADMKEEGSKLNICYYRTEKREVKAKPGNEYLVLIFKN